MNKYVTNKKRGAPFCNKVQKGIYPKQKKMQQMDQFKLNSMKEIIALPKFCDATHRREKRLQRENQSGETKREKGGGERRRVRFFFSFTIYNTIPGPRREREREREREGEGREKREKRHWHRKWWTMGWFVELYLKIATKWAAEQLPGVPQDGGSGGLMGGRGPRQTGPTKTSTMGSLKESTVPGRIIRFKPLLTLAFNPPPRRLNPRPFWKRLVNVPIFSNHDEEAQGV